MKLNLYETMYILRPDLGEDFVQQAIGKYRQLLVDGSASDLDIQHRGKRRLAYEIDRHRDGIYIQMNYKAPGAAIAPMEKAMKMSEEVIRYLTIKLESVEELVGKAAVPTVGEAPVDSSGPVSELDITPPDEQPAPEEAPAEPEATGEPEPEEAASEPEESEANDAEPEASEAPEEEASETTEEAVEGEPEPAGA